MITQNLFSLLGELFQVGKRPNTFLRLLGGLQGQVTETTAKEFPTGVYYSLRAPSQPSVLEGANAPAAQNRTITQSTNVIQIFQEAIAITYLAMGDKTMAGVVPIPQGAANGPVINPRDEAWQIKAALDTIAQDANYSFLNGVFANPADPSGVALRTRGLLTGLTTNVVDHSADANITPAMYRSYFNSMLAQMIASNGYLIDETFTVMAGVTEYANICAAYEQLGTQYLQAEQEVFGVKVRKIVTRFGTLLLALDPDMPAQTVAIIDMGVCGVVGMPVPGKGLIFAEMLAKTGSAESWQIYGQLGFDGAYEALHGKFKVPAVSL